MIFLLNLVLILVVGIVLGREWNKHIVQAAKEEHLRQMDEIFDEVKRLRAQVANMIGRKDAAG